jgi:hypothetical protein
VQELLSPCRLCSNLSGICSKSTAETRSMLAVFDPHQYPAAESAVFDIRDWQLRIACPHTTSASSTLCSAQTGIHSSAFNTELISPTRKALRKP